MKVLHIARTDGGGAGMGMMNQHQALLSLGVDSKVLVKDKLTHSDTVFEAIPNQHVWGTSKLVLLLEKVARHLGINFTRFDKIAYHIYKVNRKHPTTFSTPITQYDVSQHPLVQEADVINLHFISSFVDIEGFFRHVNKPIIWTMRDENPGLGGFHYSKTKAELMPYYADMENEFLEIKRSAIGSCTHLHLVSLSSLMQRFCQNVDFLACHPNTVIYNTVSADNYVIYEKKEAKRKLGLSEDDIVISFVGYSLGDERKGLRKLLAALSLLNDERIKLLCVGRKNMQIEDSNVVALGFVGDKERLSLIYSASDAFVSPSLQESFGKTIVEALYCGTPVVSTPVGIAPEIINESNGVLCDNTPAGIAKAITEVMERSYDRDKMREECINLFSPSKIASKYLQLYRSILEKKHSSL